MRTPALVAVLALAAPRGGRGDPSHHARRRRERGHVPGVWHAAERGRVAPGRPGARLHPRLVAQGKTKAEIKRDLVAQYGPNVLALPDSGDGVNWAVYVVPAVVVLAALGALVVLRAPLAAAHQGRAGRPTAAHQGRRAAGRPRARPLRLSRWRPPKPTPPSWPPSRSALSRSSRPACCRSCPATCPRSAASRWPRCRPASAGSRRSSLPAIIFCLSFTVDVRRAGHDRDRHRLDAGATTATCSTRSPAA